MLTRLHAFFIDSQWKAKDGHILGDSAIAMKTERIIMKIIL